MSETYPVAKMENSKGEVRRESVEVAEAIKALQMQLADLRKIVRAAKVPGDMEVHSRRTQ